MTKTERAEYAAKRLEELYPNPPIPLDHTDSYTLLIAVLLSAQCTDVRVNQITPLLFNRARTPQAMIKLSIEEIRDIIKPCGLSPQKSKAIWNLSKILIDKHDGHVPDDLDKLEELPGVGHKTAQVVMAQSFGVPSFPVDTHIHRLAFRWGLSDGRSVEQTERDLKALFAPKLWNKLHLQIIYYGREHCSARGCDGTKCEICKTLYPRRKTALPSTRKPVKKSHKLEKFKTGKMPKKKAKKSLKSARSARNGTRT
ncbi:MAG TPA: endonuclease III [Bdellovibrionales bacterium]|nr:endonuclease III [Bdellovibrionales bacterium]